MYQRLTPADLLYNLRGMGMQDPVLLYLYQQLRACRGPYEQAEWQERAEMTLNLMQGLPARNGLEETR